MAPYRAAPQRRDREGAGPRTKSVTRGTMEGLLKDRLLQLLRYFHNPELVGSMLLLYVIHVTSLTVNIPHSFLNGLKVIIAPTEEAVNRLRPDAKGPRPEPLREKEKEGKDPNAYDKMNAMGLVRLEISRGTLGTLAYFPSYEGMVTWAIVAMGNFFVAQGSRCAMPAKSPMGWASLTLCAALGRALWCNARLVSLLGWDNDHNKFAVLCGFTGLFLAAAATTMPPSDFFVFDLQRSASALHSWGVEMVAVAAGGGEEGGGLQEGIASDSSVGGGIGEDDFTALFLPIVAVLAACTTAAAALPSIRFAQYYQRALEKGSGASLSYRALLVVDAILPWVAAAAWVRPIPPLFLGEDRAAAWGGDWLRFGAMSGAVVVRLALARPQLQAFLDGAKESVLKELREKKVNAQAVRSKFEARFQFFVIAAAQYAAPALTVLLSLALSLHVGGSGSNSAIPGGGTLANFRGTPSFFSSSSSPPLSFSSSATGTKRGGDDQGQAAAAGTAAAAFAGGYVPAGIRVEVGAGAGVGPAGLGICNAARWAIGAQPWELAAVAAAAKAAETGPAVVPGSGVDDGIRSRSSGQGGGDSTKSGGGATEGRAGGEAGAGMGKGRLEGADGLAGLVAGRMLGLPASFLTELAGFFAWWACVSWAATYAVGVAFWRYFPEDVRVEERQRTDRTTKGKKDRDRGKGKGKAKAKGRGPSKGGRGATEAGVAGGVGSEAAGEKGSGGPSPAS